MIEEVIGKYLALLLRQMEYDMSILTNWWVICTVVPFALYVPVCMVKWYFLLAPVTVPLTVWTVGQRQPADRCKAWFLKN